VLRQCEKIDQDLLAVSLAYRYKKSRGYGMTTHSVLKRIRQSKTWRAILMMLNRSGKLPQGLTTDKTRQFKLQSRLHYGVLQISEKILKIPSGKHLRDKVAAIQSAPLSAG
jgi:hypothetical protein